MDYAKGDWLVHPSYGIGQVKEIERKHVGGRKHRYYRVEGDDTTFWIPVKDNKESRVRKLASRRKFRQVIKLFKKSPREMDPNHNKRRNRIREVMSRGSLRSAARLIRDLSASDSEKKLSDTERRALDQVIDSFVAEWSLAEEIDEEAARSELKVLLGSDPGPS